MSAFQFEVIPGDQRGEALLASGGDLNPPSLAMWRLLVSERAWTDIFDIGANYGEMVIGADLPAGARVIAFEPNPAVRQCLALNLAASGRSIEISPAAVSAEAGTATLMIDDAWSGTTRLRGAGLPGEGLRTIEVTATTIAAELAKTPARRPAHLLVKIDVEGHELAVLRGALPVLNGLTSFAALVEVLHLSDTDLDWLVAHFTIEVFVYQGGVLLPVFPPDGTQLRERLHVPGTYKQDVVLRRKPLLDYGLVAAGGNRILADAEARHREQQADAQFRLQLADRREEMLRAQLAQANERNEALIAERDRLRIHAAWSILTPLRTTRALWRRWRQR